MKRNKFIAACVLIAFSASVPISAFAAEHANVSQARSLRTTSNKTFHSTAKVIADPSWRTGNYELGVDAEINAAGELTKVKITPPANLHRKNKPYVNTLINGDPSNEKQSFSEILKARKIKTKADFKAMRTTYNEDFDGERSEAYLGNADAVTGATISSGAVRKAILDIFEQYEASAPKPEPQPQPEPQPEPTPPAPKPEISVKDIHDPQPEPGKGPFTFSGEAEVKGLKETNPYRISVVAKFNASGQVEQFKVKPMLTEVNEQTFKAWQALVNPDKENIYTIVAQMPRRDKAAFEAMRTTYRQRYDSRRSYFYRSNYDAVTGATLTSDAVRQALINACEEFEKAAPQPSPEPVPNPEPQPEPKPQDPYTFIGHGHVEALEDWGSVPGYDVDVETTFNPADGTVKTLKIQTSKPLHPKNKTYWNILTVDEGNFYDIVHQKHICTKTDYEKMRTRYNADYDTDRVAAYTGNHDAVTGATMASNGVRLAVLDAFKQYEAKYGAVPTPAPKPEEPDNPPQPPKPKKYQFTGHATISGAKVKGGYDIAVDVTFDKEGHYVSSEPYILENSSNRYRSKNDKYWRRATGHSPKFRDARAQRTDDRSYSGGAMPVYGLRSYHEEGGVEDYAGRRTFYETIRSKNCKTYEDFSALRMTYSHDFKDKRSSRYKDNWDATTGATVTCDALKTAILDAFGQYMAQDASPDDSVPGSAYSATGTATCKGGSIRRAYTVTVRVFFDKNGNYLAAKPSAEGIYGSDKGYWVRAGGNGGNTGVFRIFAQKGVKSKADFQALQMTYRQNSVDAVTGATLTSAAIRDAIVRAFDAPKEKIK